MAKKTKSKAQGKKIVKSSSASDAAATSARKSFHRHVALTDLHAGHAVGLTPPRYWWNKTRNNAWRNKAADAQQECWNYFTSEIDALKPIDSLLLNGDMIDGRGEASGGCELISPDREVQVDIAQECIEYTGAKKAILVRGTPYHTGRQEDWENVLAKQLRGNGMEVEVRDQCFYEINGWTFDAKHEVSSSGIPHGRTTALMREKLWNILWDYLKGGQVDADIMIRSHVHYHVFCGFARYLMLTTPALQAAHTRYGARKCSGIVDFGFVHFDLPTDKDRRFTWVPHVAEVSAQRPKVLKL
jgi:hypothetical protein